MYRMFVIFYVGGIYHKMTYAWVTVSVFIHLPRMSLSTDILGYATMNKLVIFVVFGAVDEPLAPLYSGPL